MSLTVAQIGFGTLRSRAAASTWTRDPVDRLLAAHVLSVGLPLLTKDRTLLPHLDAPLATFTRSGVGSPN